MAARSSSVGDPVTQVQTPVRMPPLWAERSIDATWIPLRIGPQQLPLLAAMLRRVENFRGRSVTVPHRVAIMALVDRLTRAELSGSLKLVRREESRPAESTDQPVCG